MGPTNELYGHPKNTPLRCVPIVTGEHMRASAIFYRTSDGDSYLITAAHNIIPFRSPRGSYKTTGSYPTIDVFLPDEEGWRSTRTDIRNDPVRAIRAEGIDMLAVQAPVELDDSWVHIWTRDQLVNPSQATEKVEVTGYPGESFPDHDAGYSVESYEEGISNSATLNLENVAKNASKRARAQNPRFSFGLDESDRVDYRGYSGAPVLTTATNSPPRLVGMHVADDDGQVVDVIRSQGGKIPDTARRLQYHPSKIIPLLLE